MTTRWATMLVVGVCVAMMSSVSAEEYLWGTCTAELSGDPGFQGYWKYCLDVGWDVTGIADHGVSHVDIFLCVEACPCYCDDGYFAFPDTVGTSLGTSHSGSCALTWYGMLECKGDPTIPGDGPVVKFEYVEGTCEPGAVGSAYLCFYSVAAPGRSKTHANALAVKFGRFVIYGDLAGTLPGCFPCYSPTEGSTWSNIKALYR